jgi:uncharacterized membrane protein YoaK (UPF0700 family)
MLLLTVVTGVVDAVSILALGRVFVANMTGNVVFVGFALAGAPGFALTASLLALAGFLIGAGLGGGVAGRRNWHRAVLFRNAVMLELVLVVSCVLVAIPSGGSDPGEAARDVIAGLAAVAMGLQNAVVRKLAVPDLTTTVLTMTLTGIAADLRAGNAAVVARRLLAVATMLLGAVAGGLLVLHPGPASALGLAAALLLVVSVAAARAAAAPTWT